MISFKETHSCYLPSILENPFESPLFWGGGGRSLKSLCIIPSKRGAYCTHVINNNLCQDPGISPLFFDLTNKVTKKIKQSITLSKPVKTISSLWQEKKEEMGFFSKMYTWGNLVESLVSSVFVVVSFFYEACETNKQAFTIYHFIGSHMKLAKYIERIFLNKPQDNKKVILMKICKIVISIASSLLFLISTFFASFLTIPKLSFLFLGILGTSFTVLTPFYKKTQKPMYLILD